MDISLLTYRSGVRSLGKKKLADGNEYELFYKALTPEQVAVNLGSFGNLEKLEDMEVRGRSLNEYLSKFLSSTMCLEDGRSLVTIEQAKEIPITLKREIRDQIVVDSSKLVEEAGKD